MEHPVDQLVCMCGCNYIGEQGTDLGAQSSSYRKGIESDAK